MSMPNSTPPTWQQELGRQIKKARSDRKYPQQKLAKLLGVCSEQLRLYEKGKTPVPLEALRAIVREFDATFVLDGIVISVSSFPASLPKVVTDQMSFEFQAEYRYTGADVRVYVSKAGFEVKGHVLARAVNL